MSAAADGPVDGTGDLEAERDGGPGEPASAGDRSTGRAGWRHLKVLRRIGYDESAAQLGDFTTTWRVIPLAVIGVGLGVLSAFLAKLLLWLIAGVTNLFFFQRLSAAPVSPADHHLGPFVVLVPVVGALLIGLMARYGSERIRGHGIPEAIEAILINGSRVEPRLAVLKPLSSAISIGSGGPFGAEGPIIMTGGAFGSLISQFLHLTSAERKTLLVAGAAGGMSATFAAPVAAVLLAVELLLFEWKPRSLIPVALASATAAATRRYIMGVGPLFPVPEHAIFIGPAGLAGCILAGLLAGALSAALTAAVYAAEDGFHRLPIHWMWWPAIGAVAVGLGGLVFPQALGVGYDTIGALLQGNVPSRVILGILVVKSVIWAISLGSGTSGGVLAPLLMMGGAVGGLEALVFPNEGAGFWPLVSMGAILGGTMRSPFTGIVFALELTHDINVLLPLLVSVTIAHAFTVLAMRRSILTEKISRRGRHLGREYAVDPLEFVFVRDAMGEPGGGAADGAIAFSAPPAAGANGSAAAALEPVLVTDADDMAPAAIPAPVVAYPDETLRVVAYRMAETGITSLPVVERASPAAVVGQITLIDLLKGRVRALQEERQRDRVLRLDTALPLRFGAARHQIAQPETV